MVEDKLKIDDIKEDVMEQLLHFMWIFSQILFTIY